MKSYLKNLLDRLTTWLGQVMSESGSASSMRVAMLIWHGAFAFVWTVLSLSKREMQHIDASHLTLLGLITGAKFGQKPLESPAPAAPAPPPTP